MAEHRGRAARPFRHARRVVEDRALVLRRTDYGEADRILQLLTPEHGRVDCIARGARKQTSTSRGALATLALLHVRVDLPLAEGSRATGMGRLIEARPIFCFTRLTSELTLLYAVGDLCTLCRALIPRDSPAHDAFALLQNVMVHCDAAAALRRCDVEAAPRMDAAAAPDPLPSPPTMAASTAAPTAASTAASTNAPIEQAIARCLVGQLMVLEALGIGPELHRCGRCGKSPLPSQSARFFPTVGALLCRTCLLDLRAPSDKALGHPDHPTASSSFLNDARPGDAPPVTLHGETRSLLQILAHELREGSGSGRPTMLASTLASTATNPGADAAASLADAWNDCAAHVQSCSRHGASVEAGVLAELRSLVETVRQTSGVQAKPASRSAG